MRNTDLKRQIANEFDYYIKQKHCKPNGGKMQLQAMCQSCRHANQNQEALIKIKDAIIHSL